VPFSLGGYSPHAASETLKNEYGDPKDKHTLLQALLEAAGIRAFPALVSSPAILILISRHLPAITLIMVNSRAQMTRNQDQDCGWRRPAPGTREFLPLREVPGAKCVYLWGRHTRSLEFACCMRRITAEAERHVCGAHLGRDKIVQCLNFFRLRGSTRVNSSAFARTAASGLTRSRTSGA